MTPSVVHSKLGTIVLENRSVKSSQTYFMHVDVIRNVQNISLKKFCRADERKKNYFLSIGFVTPEDCKYRELIFKTEIMDFFLFCQEKPFGELFSKTCPRGFDFEKSNKK